MNDIKEILVKANYARKSNWLQAEKILQDGLEMYPQSDELSVELADLYFRNRYYRQAIKTCQSALMYHDRNDLIKIIANSFLSLKEYRIAIDYYQKISNEKPEILYNMAVAYARLNKHEKAIELINKVIEYDIKTPVPYILLAELYLSTKKYKEVISCCNRAESISGISGDILFIRGMAWLAQKNLLKAYWDFHLGEGFKISNPEYYRSYGIVCEGIGKTDQAISLLKKAIDYAPDRPGSYLELFRIYFSNNMLTEATDLLQQARDALPSDFPLTIMYNQIIDRLTESHH